MREATGAKLRGPGWLTSEITVACARQAPRFFREREFSGNDMLGQFVPSNRGI